VPPGEGQGQPQPAQLLQVHGTAVAMIAADHLFVCLLLLQVWPEAGQGQPQPAQLLQVHGAQLRGAQTRGEERRPRRQGGQCTGGLVAVWSFRVSALCSCCEKYLHVGPVTISDGMRHSLDGGVYSTSKRAQTTTQRWAGTSTVML
jgi:hypothetical protein